MFFSFLPPNEDDDRSPRVFYVSLLSKTVLVLGANVPNSWLGRGILANWTVIWSVERLSVLQLTDKMPTTVVGKEF